MASIYDEINQIKREGSDYDTSLNSSEPTIGLNDYIQSLNSRPINKQASTPTFAGGQYAGYGDSQYDTGLTYFDELSNSGSLENLRALNQPWYDQIGNNLANMGVIATTTFADSFVGTAAGLINMAFCYKEPQQEGDLGYGEQALDKFVNNPVSLWLNSINKWVKSELPTYHTDEYMQNQAEGKWWRNMGTSAFWGETILENAGFTLGMVASGKVSGSWLNKAAKLGEQSNIIRNGVNTAIQEGRIAGATMADADKIYKQVINGKRALDGLDLTGEMAQAVKNINQISSVNRNLATAIAVTGEARQEGINSSQEYKEQQLINLESLQGQQELMTKTLYDLYSRNPEMFNYNPVDGEALQSIKPEYIETLNKEFEKNQTNAVNEINNASARVAGMDFALNFPILYASSLWQFGRTFSRGYDTQRGFMNNLRGAIRQGASDSALEGSERIVREGGQYVVKNSVGDRIIRGLKIASNPLVEANEEMLQASAQTASERYAGAKMNSFLGYKLDPESEQEQIGKMNAIWNGIMDTYSDPAKYQEGFAGLIMGGMGSLNFTFSKNKQGKRPIFEGGVWQDIRDARQENQDLQAATDALNKRLADPEFLNYYQGLIRHDALEKNKTEALEKDDKFSFLNNDHAQLISDIIMFEKAGKLQDLYDNIDNNIEKFSTTDKTQITEIADELRELGKNKETGQDMFQDRTDEEIVQESLKFNQELKDNVDNYRTITNNLKSLIGSKFLEEDDFNEMVYMFSQIDNFEKRYTGLHNGLVEKLNNIKSSELHNKLFQINLDNSEKSLTLAEIIEQASPSELNEFLLGANRPESKEFDYLRGLMSSNEMLLGNVSEIIKTISEISSNTNKRGELTNQQEREIGRQKETIKTINDILSRTKERESIMTDLVDLLKIEDARAKLTNTYNKFVGRPYLLRQHLEDEEEKAAEGQDEAVTRTVRDELKEAQSLSDIRTIVDREVNDKGNNAMDRIIAEMSLSDNKDFAPLVSEYRQIENLNSEINNSEVAKNTTDDVMNGVNQLFNILKDKANTYSELVSPNITQEDLSELGGRNVNYPQDMREEIRDTLLNILKEINERNQKYGNVSERLKPAVQDKGQNKQDTSTPNDVPIGNITSKQAEKDNKDIRGKLDRKNEVIPSTDKIWNNGTFEIDIDVYNSTGRIVPQNNTTYKPAVEFLKENGAFDYINSGKLERGAKVFFYASQSYWDELVNKGSDPQWVEANKPLLLVVEDSEGNVNSNGKRYQIVGTFNSNLNPKLHQEVLGSNNTTETIEDYEVFTPQGEVFNDEENRRIHSGKVLYNSSNGFRLLEQTDDNGRTTYRVTNADQLYHTKSYNTVEQALTNMKKNASAVKPTKKKTTPKSTTNKGINESISTSVVNVTPGRLEFNDEKLLSSLQGNSPSGERIETLFGIADDTGGLTTNLDATQYGVFNITPTTDFSNSGRLYLLTKSASTDNYIPTAVRVKNLSEVDYSKDTPLFNELRRAINNISVAALSSNEESVANAVHDLRNILYVGSKAGLSINLRTEPQGPRTDYNLVLTKEDGSIEVVNVGYSEMVEIPDTSDNGYESVMRLNTEEQITDGLLSSLSKLKAPFQVNKNYINGKWNVRQSLSYNDVLIQSDILTTNLSNNYVRGAYFVMNPIDNNLKEVPNTNTTVNEKNNNPSKPTITNTSDNTPNGKALHIGKKGTFYLTDKGEVLTDKGELVRDTRTINQVKVKNYLQGKTSEEMKEIKFTGEELFPGGSMFNGRELFLMPSGQLWDSNAQVLLSGGLYDIAIQRVLRERKEAQEPLPENIPLPTQEDEYGQDYSGETEEEVSAFGDEVEEEVSAFDEPTPKPQRRERKRPDKGSVSRNITDLNTQSNMTKEDIQDKIDENKDYQKDNCNGIAPL